MNKFWNGFIILVMLIVVVTFSRESEAYDFKYGNPKQHPQINEAVAILSDKMKFSDVEMPPPKLQKAKRELASCQVDMMMHDAQEYDLNENDFLSMYNGVVDYYFLHNTPLFSAMNQEDVNYAYDLEHRCADYHPQQKERISPRMALQEAEEIVADQCNWDSVSTPDEYEAARECRVKIHKTIYEKYGLDY